MTTKTLAEKIVDAQARLAKLLGEQSAAAARANVAIGSSLTFKYGRGDTVRNITGTVAAVDAEAGKLVVLDGIKPYTIFFRDIVGSDETPAEAPAVDANDPAAQGTPSVVNDGAASEDPLNAA